MSSGGRLVVISGTQSERDFVLNCVVARGEGSPLMPMMRATWSECRPRAMHGAIVREQLRLGASSPPEVGGIARA